MNFDFRVPEGSKQKLQEIMPNFQSDVAFCGGSVIAPKAVITSARVSKLFVLFKNIEARLPENSTLYWRPRRRRCSTMFRCHNSWDLRRNTHKIGSRSLRSLFGKRKSWSIRLNYVSAKKSCQISLLASKMEFNKLLRWCRHLAAWKRTRFQSVRLANMSTITSGLPCWIFVHDIGIWFNNEHCEWRG